MSYKQINDSFFGIHKWGKKKQWIINNEIKYTKKCKKCQKLKKA
jgi:hypothetical protein